MEKNGNYAGEKVKTFISALPDTEEELNILLNYINIFNKSGQIFRFNIVGNNHVISTLKKLELEKKLNIEDMVDKDQLTIALDSGSFTSDNVDFFINLIWTQIVDSNYPQTSLKEDFYNALKLDDEELFDNGATFYASCRKTSLSDNVDKNELYKVEALKKDMSDKTILFDYHSLDEFKQFSSEDIEGFKYSRDIEEILNKSKKSNLSNRDSKEMFNVFAEIFNELAEGIPSNEDTSDFNNLISLIDEDNFEKFSEELEEKNQKEYGLFDDIFQYLEKTFEEFNNLNNAFEEENKLVLDDFDYSSKNPDKISKLLTNFSKVFNKLSNEYEQERDENREFRSKSLGVLLPFSKGKNQDSKELFGFFVDSKNYFEELSSAIENYIIIFIETVNIFPVSNEDYEKSVTTILKEGNKILENLKFIKTEMNDLNKKFTRILKNK